VRFPHFRRCRLVPPSQHCPDVALLLDLLLLNDHLRNGFLAGARELRPHLRAPLPPGEILLDSLDNRMAALLDHLTQILAVVEVFMNVDFGRGSEIQAPL